MPEGNFAVWHALCPGKTDIVLIGLVHHVPPQPHGIIGDITDGQGDDGQNVALGIGRVKQHGKSQNILADIGLRTEELNQNMIHRRGHGLHQHDEHRAQPVADLEAGTGASRHDDTQRKPQRQSNAQRNQSQLQRDGDLLGNDLGDGDAFPVDVGFSQIAVEYLLVKAHQLGGQGSGHAERLKLHLNLGGAHFIVILKIPFHRHQPQQGKEDRDNDKHGNKGSQNALGYISGHMMSSWVFLPSYDFLIKWGKTVLFTH